MRILTVHNYYQQAGGEDIVFAEEAQMLRDNGHDVFEFVAHNSDLQHKSHLAIAVNTLWSSTAKQSLAAKIEQVKPNLVHFHNTFMSISPAAYYACKEAGLPVVQTLHNYRLICPKATLFRDGAVCTDCVRTAHYAPSIRHRCYRDSRLHTAGVVTMLAFHRLRKTWDEQVDAYICLSESGRQYFIDSGLPPAKLVTKGNFLQHDPGYSDEDHNFFLFMGRLTPEKGIRVLIDAWRHLPDIPLRILGDGDLRDELEGAIRDHQMTNVEFLGHQPRDKALAMLKQATAQIVPSQWLEPFGLVAIEAFACGTPVIASDIGALSDIVADGVTGFHFTSGDPASLVEKVRYLWERPAAERRTLSRCARHEYDTKYTSAVNYRQLIAIYNKLLS